MLFKKKKLIHFNVKFGNLKVSKRTTIDGCLSMPTLVFTESSKFTESNTFSLSNTFTKLSLFTGPLRSGTALTSTFILTHSLLLTYEKRCPFAIRRFRFRFRSPEVLISNRRSSTTSTQMLHTYFTSASSMFKHVWHNRWAATQLCVLCDWSRCCCGSACCPFN